MALLIEEAISTEPMTITDKQSPTGTTYKHYDLEYKGKEYCAIPIIRAGDSMLNEIFQLVPGITVGKILIQRDELSEDKHPVLIYTKFPPDIA